MAGVFRLPHLKKYLLLSVLLTFTLTVINFPYEKIATQKLKNINNRNFKIQTIDNLNISLLGSSTLDEMVIMFKDSSQLNVRNTFFNLPLNLFRLSKGNYYSSFKINSAKFNHNQINMLSSLGGDLDIELSKNGLPRTGFLIITLNDTFIKLNNVSLPPSLGGLPVDIKEIKLKKINLNVSFNNETAEIKDISTYGSDLKLKCEGNIKLRNIVRNSRLDLTVTVNKDSGSLEKYRDLLNGLSQGNEIKLKITGSFLRPKVEIVK